MSDARLFNIADGNIVELASMPVGPERDLQNVFEKTRQTFLSIRLLASEYPIEGGRMNALGIEDLKRAKEFIKLAYEVS